MKRILLWIVFPLCLLRSYGQREVYPSIPRVDINDVFGQVQIFFGSQRNRSVVQWKGESTDRTVSYCGYEVKRFIEHGPRLRGAYYADEIYGEVPIDGVWTDVLKQEYLFLNHDLARCNRQLKGKTFRPHKVLCFRFLIELHKSEKYKLHVLEPIEQSKEEKVAIKRLQKIFSKLPHDCLFPLFTTDGRLFPYRIVDAYCFLSGGWEVQDYLYAMPSYRKSGE